MALSPLFWNNGWSSQLSLSLDSLIPLMHCAVCPRGGLLIEEGKKKKQPTRPAGISEMLFKELRHSCVLYSVDESNFFSFLCKKTKQNKKRVYLLSMLIHN